MPLPLILPGLAGFVLSVGAVIVQDKVSSAQNKEIDSAIEQVSQRLTEEINIALGEFEEYETKIKSQFNVSIGCFLLFCFIALFFDHWTWLVAIVVAFLSMNLFADLVVDWIYKYRDVASCFRNAFWKRWKKDKLAFTRKNSTRATHEAVKMVIQNRMESDNVRRKIEAEVNKALDNLAFIDKWAHNIFGDKREYIVNRIYKGALNGIPYDEVVQRLKRISRRIVVMILTFSIIASLIRFGIIDSSDLGWLKWAVLPIFFGTCFCWHRLRMLMGGNNMRMGFMGNTR